MFLLYAILQKKHRNYKNSKHKNMRNGKNIKTASITIWMPFYHKVTVNGLLHDLT